MKLLSFSVVAAVAASAATSASSASASSAVNPTVKLNNGVDLPLVALGVWQYDNKTAADAISKALQIGYTHIDTAWNYYNQEGVGQALKGVARDAFFLTTKTPPCATTMDTTACAAQTRQQLQNDLQQLQLNHVDLVLIHGSSSGRTGACDAHACELDYAQWQVYEEFYQQGKTRAIGVSNYCVSCLKCLYSKPIKVKPTINQFQYHVGMGASESIQALLDECKENDLIPQAYSPLGNGKLISDPDLAKVASHYNKSTAQVALKWIVSQDIPLATKADNVEYLEEDFDLFSWNFTAEDMAFLNKKDQPASRPSWSCTS